MGKPHKHRDAMIALANGAKLQWRDPSWAAKAWQDFAEDEAEFHNDFEYRIKPEPEYPKSSMTADECAAIYVSAPGGFAAGMKAVADAAVSRHCQDQEKENV